jgi:two-component system, chemotaxis family, chemotaxis protein CheY
MSSEKYKDKVVLLIEDNEQSRALLIRALRALEFPRIIKAQNGQAGLKKLYLNKMNLIICDWRMPEMSGLEFYKTAEKDNLLKDVAFLMVSAENEKEKVIVALKAVIKDYMVKPINVDLLEQKIENLWG